MLLNMILYWKYCAVIELKNKLFEIRHCYSGFDWFLNIIQLKNNLQKSKIKNIIVNQWKLLFNMVMQWLWKYLCIEL